MLCSPTCHTFYGVRARYGLMGASTETAAVDFRFAGAEDTAEILTLVSESREYYYCRVGKKGKRRVRCEGGSRSFMLHLLILPVLLNCSTNYCSI